MDEKIKITLSLENIFVFATGIFFILFPILITTVTTDAFSIPKQTAAGVLAIVGLIFLGVRWVINRSVRIRRTPFDVPVFLFGLAALLSSIFAVNRFDSMVAFFPLLFAIVIYFLITNSTKRPQDVLFLSGSLVIGAVIVSFITVLSYFKIYLFPFEFAKAQTFTPFGSLFDQSIYLVLVLSLALYLALPALRKKAVDRSRAVFVFGSLVLLAGTLVSLLAAFTLQKPNILPVQTGFQIGFASISQDTGRVIQGFLMGSGFGTFLNDFTRFKPATINADPTLWNLSFLRSSSFFLELIATTGLLGVISFLFLSYRILRSKPLFIPLVIALVLAFILPFSYGIILLLFVLLGIYSAQQGLVDRQKTKFFDVELRFVTLKRGVFALADPQSRGESEYGNLLPYGLMGIIVLFSLFVGIPAAKFIYSDYLFQKSLVAASKNEAQKTYELQTRAINMFPQRDGYHRIFSQINLNLANNVAASVPQGASPSAEVQNTIYKLIQQSINSGRNATTISPQTSVNWQNLSSIYRSLIGFGQNADSFAVISNQQAILLDPNNPQGYINYGGIFYQLGQWDNAIRQFQIAVSLKPDFANAYYNLGHALEQKGDLETALTQYRTVRSLVATDKSSIEQIDKEIASLQGKIGSAATNANQPQVQSGENQPPIELNQPAAKLPEQDPPVKIPGPTNTPTPTPSPKPTATPTPTPNL